jgi:hypothetical protein
MAVHSHDDTMQRRRRWWTFALIAGGVVLMLPGLYVSGMSGASTEDWEVASTPVGRLPLDSVRAARSASMVFTVPTTDQWVRIRDAWGEPRYVVFARGGAGDSAVIAWNSLELEVTGSTGLGPLDMAVAVQLPNSLPPNASGVMFQPRPGEKVRLNIKAMNPAAVPNGELVVRAAWDGDPKGRAVGMLFSVDLRPYLRMGLLCGVVLLVVAAVLGNWRTA